MRFRPDLGWSDVTPRADFLNRRQLIGGAAMLGMGGLGLPAAALDAVESKYSTNAEPNTLEEITGYCNFYEFGTDKGDPARHAGQMTTDPWSVEIGGLVEKPGRYDLADVLKGQSLEERIYRLRCVEAWSMVVPWIGFQLSGLLERVGVQPSAKYVAFETLYRPEEMPGTRRPVIPWPYVEGLRLDEAMNPLTILATGLYGEELPAPNGAPIRLVVPWKYGFKSIKSVVKITLTEDQPPATWNMVNPREYGFYSNVNPEVDHPRWSQAEERRVGGGFFAAKIPTQKFNGYGQYVASLYDGMDLSRQF
ncbi:protein-methionine-sulfoxide reductase catalytic subunit MsrP [Mangrovicoccus algicola]|uniref:Protein-methionine-sulfoxide reductase catalytic subunit MsrP n=1 Tax=Mangrovicoccus algicola TaxID=2771008 RepID=A0A8J6ZFM8_9RHOB|nr:protein-methionine-sulfoxide reductase catalytic subunit MsrP [Mangrovicoccus algicola]MBE3640601.1 protein-methionine-sulfoxide reductase catalytic subunit MsrP [Mangrovicoccus algicola]